MNQVLAIDQPKSTYFLPAKFYNSAADIIKHINNVTQKFTVTRKIGNVSAKRKGIFLKYEQEKVHINLNYGYGIHLGSDICDFLGIQHRNITPNKRGHIVMREKEQFECLPIANERHKPTTLLVCTDLIKSEFFGSGKLPLLKAIVCGNENSDSYYFNPITFCNLNKSHFESFNIKILEPENKIVKFGKIPVYFQLVFRKKL
jgi:hypothetical protein